MEGEKMKQVKK